MTPTTPSLSDLEHVSCGSTGPTKPRKMRLYASTKAWMWWWVVSIGRRYRSDTTASLGGRLPWDRRTVKKKNPPRRTWYRFYVDRIAFWRAQKTWHRGIYATKKEPSLAHLLRDFTAIVAPSFSGGGHGGKYCFEGCDAGYKCRHQWVGL